MYNDSAAAFLTLSLVYWLIFLAVAFGVTWYLLGQIEQFAQEEQTMYKPIQVQLPPHTLHPAAQNIR